MGKIERPEGWTVQDRFAEAKGNYEYWTGQYEKAPHEALSMDCLIAAAQQWGIMCGLAAAAPELKPQLDAIDARLYPSDYPEAEAVPF